MLVKTRIARNQKARAQKHNGKGRKSQLEMIGLTVIVVIVITGLLIVTVYKFNSSPRSIQKRYINKETATNLLISMTNTNVGDCNNLTLGELLTDCGSSYPSINCFDFTSCEIANQTIEVLLNRTLMSSSWNLSFEMRIVSPFQGDISRFVNLNCGSTSKEQEQAFELLPLEAQNVLEITLTLCIDK
ncbi:MAG TPA: hypothetical protein VJ461_00320 [Candidatus Nanoarchaeia archaeon]|nr:hypothetical protein [Candidatus Nanoarchaeia archaeon]